MSKQDQSNKAIVLLQQLIGITTNKNDNNAELFSMLKQTQTVVKPQNKFNIIKLPATKATGSRASKFYRSSLFNPNCNV